MRVSYRLMFPTKFGSVASFCHVVNTTENNAYRSIVACRFPERQKRHCDAIVATEGIDRQENIRSLLECLMFAVESVQSLQIPLSVLCMQIVLPPHSFVRGLYRVGARVLVRMQCVLVGVRLFFQVMSLVRLRLFIMF